MQLGQITEAKIDQAGPPSTAEFTYVDISSVDNNAKRIVEPKRLPAASAPSRARQRLRSGDVLVSMTRPNLNAVALVPPELDGAVGSTGFHVLRAREKVLPQWLYYGVQTRKFVGAMSELVQGALYPAVRPKDIRTFDLPVPELDEQRRIVAEIEKQFSRLDEAVASLKRVKANLKCYKAAVLKAAVEGRLVPTEADIARREDRSYETGGQLLRRIVEARSSEKRGRSKRYELFSEAPRPAPLPDGWVWANYGQVGRLQLGRQRAPKYHSGPNMRLYLRVQNVFEDHLDLSDVMEMNFPPTDYEKYSLVPGDLLLNEGQSPELLGRPAIYRGELPGACFTNTLIRFQPADGVRVEFALLVARHHMHAGRFVDEGTITTNIAHLSVGRLATVEFPLPPTAEQDRLVAESDRQLSIIAALERSVTFAELQVAKLRAAILKNAYSITAHIDHAETASCT